MKNLLILLSAAAIFSGTGCTQPNTADMMKNDAQKKEIFSAILSNDQASSELMDSMLMTHHGQLMTKMNDLMKNDTGMQTGMMNSMMDMSKSDTTMCKMMMGKTMDMCDMDKSKCSMMIGSMKEHPAAMKSMQDMGMCDMKGMKMEKNK